MKNNKQLKTLLACGIVAGLVSAQAVADCANEFQRLKPTHQYTDNFDGTVTDGVTNKTWQKCPIGTSWNGGADNTTGADDSCQGSASRYNWAAALVAVPAGWHMPNKKELASMFDLACKNPAVNSSAFPANTVSGNLVWTSTPVKSNDRKAWAYLYHNGEDVQKPKNAEGVVFLVRD